MKKYSPTTARTAHWLLSLWLVWVGGSGVGAREAGAPSQTSAALRKLKASAELGRHRIHLEATVYFVSLARDYLVVGDQDGFIDFAIDSLESPFQFGDRVLLEGIAELGASRSRLGKIPTVDNDGTHAEQWQKGDVRLEAGWHRFELEYFQRLGNQALRLNWRGPGFPQQPLSTAALFQLPSTDPVPAVNLKPGLHFSCYRGEWVALPNFTGLQPVKTGVTTQYDPHSFGLDINFAVRFTGWLNVTNAGLYSFALSSDDGSRLYLDAEVPTFVRLGRGAVRTVQHLGLEHRSLAGEKDEFVELQGTPQFVGGMDGMRLQLSGVNQTTEVRISGGGPWHPTLLANSRLRLQGVLQRILDQSGRTNDQRLMVDGRSGVLEVSPAPSLWRMVPPTPLQSLATLTDRSPLVHATGKAIRYLDDALLIRDDTGELAVFSDQKPLPQLGADVDVLGRLRRVGERTAVVGAVFGAVAPRSAPDSAVLTNLDQVHRLSRTEIRRERAADVTAVAVLSQSPWLFMRDLTGTIFVAPNWPTAPLPKVGEVYRIEGHTAAETDSYTPFLYPVRATFLGIAPLPDPLRPTWDELMTGNLDAQWIELDGIASTVSGDTFVLTTPGGKLGAQVLSGRIHPPELEGAMVRVRGCCSVSLAESGQISSTIMLVQSWDFVCVTVPAPADPFALPCRAIGSLLSFDADASSLRYVRVAGTILHSEGTLCFLTDGTNGVRFVTKRAESLHGGDVVDVAGILDATSQAAVVREAVVRRRRSGRLPAPALATAAELSAGRWDASLIKTEGLLLNTSTNPTAQILEVDIGNRIASARLSAGRGLVRDLRVGSRIELLGVCNGRYTDDVSAKGFDTYEILLASPASIRVVSAPSWWRAQHTVAVVAGLVGVLLLAGGWITTLRRQVEQRTGELQVEIDQHRRTETMLEDEIAERKRMETQVEKTHQELLIASREAGMAEVASSVLHNVGNVLNSVNVSTTLLSEQVRKSKVGNFSKAVDLIRQHAGDLGAFLTEDPKGKQLPAYLGLLSERLAFEQTTVLTELRTLTKSVEHIKEIVAMQQSYGRNSGMLARVNLADLLQDALHMNATELENSQVQVRREYDPAVPEIIMDRHKLLQILVNLIRNARYACQESGSGEHCLTVRLCRAKGAVQIVVIDDGVGIPAENLTRIFQQGFTTRKDGHGYGLHSGALAAKELGGSLTAQSDGPGQGARFTLTLPSGAV